MPKIYKGVVQVPVQLWHAAEFLRPPQSDKANVVGLQGQTWHDSLQQQAGQVNPEASYITLSGSSRLLVSEYFGPAIAYNPDLAQVQGTAPTENYLSVGALSFETSTPSEVDARIAEANATMLPVFNTIGSGDFRVRGGADPLEVGSVNYGIPTSVTSVTLAPAIVSQLKNTMRKNKVSLAKVEFELGGLSSQFLYPGTGSTNQKHELAVLNTPQARDGGEGVTRYSATVAIHCVLDSDTGEWTFSAAADPTATGPYPAAANAAKQYEKEMLQEKAESRQNAGPAEPSPAKPRPPETESPSLSPSQRKEMDDWWKEMEEGRKDLEKAGASGGINEMYQKYLDAGGTKTLAEFKGALDGDKDVKEKSWIESLAELLGIGVDKTAEVVLGVSKEAGSVMKEWGPIGTVGAYTGVRAANSVTSTNQWLLYGGIALAAILLLR